MGESLSYEILQLSTGHKEMDLKNYNKQPEKALSFDDWKANLAPSFSDEHMKSMNRLHKIDYQSEFDRMLRREYNEYLDNLNGNWLLR